MKLIQFEVYFTDIKIKIFLFNILQIISFKKSLLKKNKMASTSCLFWIKFFIWIAASSGLGAIINIFLLNPISSNILAGVITSPILFADYIVRYYIDKNKKNIIVEKVRLKQDELESLGAGEYDIVVCPKCGKKNFLGTSHCNSCGKDLRVIT